MCSTSIKLKHSGLVPTKGRVKWILLAILLCCGLAAFAQDSVLYGDVNNDGAIGILDSLMIAQYYVGITPGEFNSVAADVDGNGAVNVIDALIVAQYYVGLISVFPVQALAGVELVKSDLEQNLSPQLATGELDAVVEGNNRFAFDCFELLKNDPQNLFYSPVSLSFALAMCYAGAQGNTRTEMAQALHFTLPDPALHNAYNALDIRLTHVPAVTDPYLGDELVLNIANSVWGQRGYPFVSGYLDTLGYYYGAGLNVVDFSSAPEQCRLLINDWVSDQTETRIPEIIPQGAITPLTRLVLANAIYFYGNWYTPFEPEDTQAESFYALDGSVPEVQMMRQLLEASYYEESGRFQAVKLNYQGTRKNSMILVLPAEGQFAAIENDFTYETYTDIRQGFGSARVRLGLPKFSYAWGQSMTGTLKALGMTDAFNPSRADFTGISNEPGFYISDVLHKSFVALDEKGTEATAATVVIMAGSGPNPPTPPPPVTMTLDRPFFFLICNEDTGTILFVGRVLKPEL
jgi:serpin B